MNQASLGQDQAWRRGGVWTNKWTNGPTNGQEFPLCSTGLHPLMGLCPASLQAQARELLTIYCPGQLVYPNGQLCTITNASITAATITAIAVSSAFITTATAINATTANHPTLRTNCWSLGRDEVPCHSYPFLKDGVSIHQSVHPSFRPSIFSPKSICWCMCLSVTH